MDANIIQTSSQADYLSVVQKLKSSLSQHIIGQDKLLSRLLVALFADGHLLVEGVPGLAKTKAIKTLANHLEGSFQRIQFTPDLLPSDITGTEIYNAAGSNFYFEPGPIFHNLVLADEINRAPAKVQSALLEAMAERQVSIGKKTYALPRLFLVMATQNPLEQAGTYALPEAQLDRFLLHASVSYPDSKTELAILDCVEAEEMTQIKPLQLLTQSMIFAIREQILAVHMGENLKRYVVEIIMTTRNPKKYSDKLAKWLALGASPRATIAMVRCAKTLAWMEGRDYVMPEDVKEIAADVLRHRLILNFAAEAEGVRAQHCIDKILSLVAVP